MRCVELHVV